MLQSLLLVRSLDLCDDGSCRRRRRRLIIELSTTSITSLISCVLAGDITTDSGIPFLSVKMCLFVPSLLLSTGLFPVIAPLKATLLIYYRVIAMSSLYLFYYHRFSIV